MRLLVLLALLPAIAWGQLAPMLIGTGWSGPPQGGGASLVFNCNGFSTGQTNCTTTNVSFAPGGAAFSGSQLLLTPVGSSHAASGAWWSVKQNIQSFTTDFTFQIPGSLHAGITFGVQNHNDVATADANADGYGAYASQPGVAVPLSVAIAFDTSSLNSTAYVGSVSSTAALFINGGNVVDQGLAPVTDLHTLGITLSSGDVMQVHVVYDGTLLTMALTDTTTGASTTLSWPVNIPAVVGGNTAWVGFTGGTPPSGQGGLAINSWDWYSGYDVELTQPTFSPAPGAYTTTQTVSIGCPSGATCYYTTNGLPPTSSSTQYTGPITVSSSEYIQAIAAASNFTDSYVAGGNYSIGTSGSPFVNFPSGFASNGGLMQLSGYASLSGSNIVLTDTAQASETASACYAAPLNVQSFTWSTTLTQAGSANGMTLVIRAPLPASMDPTNGTTGDQADGGPYDYAQTAAALGYYPTAASIGVSLNLYSPASSTGLFENGTSPTTGTSTSPVTLGVSGHSYTALLTYSGTTLTEQINDTTAGTQYGPVNYTVNIPSVIGSNTAYICATGTTGGLSATQELTAMTFHN